MIREAQRHLDQWTLEPIATLIAEEATEKLGSPVKLDVAHPLQAFDTGGRERALGAIVKVAAEAKSAGVSDDFTKALALVDWKSE